jgi:hypothetical protein
LGEGKPGSAKDFGEVGGFKKRQDQNSCEEAIFQTESATHDIEKNENLNKKWGSANYLHDQRAQLSDREPSLQTSQCEGKSQGERKSEGGSAEQKSGKPSSEKLFPICPDRVPVPFPVQAGERQS